MHGEIQRCARHHLLVVNVSGMDAGRRAADLSIGFRRSYSHAAEEGMQRNLDARSKPGDHSLAIEGNDLGARVSEILRQESGPKTEPVVGIGDREIDFLDVYFQRISRLSAVDVHRSIEDVAARAMGRDLFIY